MKNYSKFLFIAFLCLTTRSYATVSGATTELSGGLNVTLSDAWEKRELNQSGVIYHAVSEKDGLELSICTDRTLKSNLIHSWKNLRAVELNKIATALCKNNRKNDGQEVSPFYDGWSLHKTPQMTFIGLRGRTLDRGNKRVFSYFSQYSTIVNGGVLQAVFYRQDRPLSELENQETLRIIESLHYAALTEKGLDRPIILKLMGLGFITALLIASVVFHIRRYRRRHSIEIH